MQTREARPSRRAESVLLQLLLALGVRASAAKSCWRGGVGCQGTSEPPCPHALARTGRTAGGDVPAAPRIQRDGSSLPGVAPLPDVSASASSSKTLQPGGVITTEFESESSQATVQVVFRGALRRDLQVVVFCFLCKPFPLTVSGLFSVKAARVFKAPLIIAINIMVSIVETTDKIYLLYLFILIF